MRFLKYVFSVCLICLASIASATENDDWQPKKADIRLLIDVSGSMKKTDPANLRRPALDLLVNLFPLNDRAGVWTFGDKVTSLVPYGKVTESFKQAALSKSQFIDANEPFTDIGAALLQAAFSSDELREGFDQHIILLTDGMIDVSKDQAVNLKAHAELIGEILPKIQRAGFKVHAIALSADADRELLEKIALMTDGGFAVAESADELMKVFLGLFDQAVPQERLPLVDNQFQVDASVEEFTALVFSDQPRKPLQLINPDGIVITAENILEGTRWYTTTTYDLVTVQKPMVGNWQWVANIDPDNRVTVLSNLSLRVKALPNNLEVGAPLDFAYQLQESDKAVVDPQFLQLLNMDIDIQRERDARVWQMPVANIEPPIDGVYQQTLEHFKEAGRYQLRLRLDGKTFKREYIHHLKVGSPFSVKLDKVIKNDEFYYLLSVAVDDERINIEKTTVSAMVKSAEGDQRKLPLVYAAETGLWQVKIIPWMETRFSVSLDVLADRNDGLILAVHLPTQYFHFPDVGDPDIDFSLQPQSGNAPLILDATTAGQFPIAMQTQTSESLWSIITNYWYLWLVALVGIILTTVYFLKRILVKKIDTEDSNLQHQTSFATPLTEPLSMSEVSELSEPNLSVNSEAIDIDQIPTLDADFDSIVSADELGSASEKPDQSPS